MRTRVEILKLADACHEMYELEDLQDGAYMMRHLSSHHPELARHELLEAILLALHWKSLRGLGIMVEH